MGNFDVFLDQLPRMQAQFISALRAVDPRRRQSYPLVGLLVDFFCPAASLAAVRQISSWTAEFHDRLGDSVVQLAQTKGQELINAEAVDRAVCRVLSQLMSEFEGGSGLDSSSDEVKGAA